MEQVTMIIMPEKTYNGILKELEEIKQLIKGKAKDEAKTQWLESSEARKILGVSAKTWQTFRDNRVLPFSQFGRKIYVRRTDLDAFLLNHQIRKK